MWEGGKGDGGEELWTEQGGGGGIGGGREEVGEEGWSTEEDGVRR